MEPDETTILLAEEHPANRAVGVYSLPLAVTNAVSARIAEPCEVAQRWVQSPLGDEAAVDYRWHKGAVEWQDQFIGLSWVALQRTSRTRQTATKRHQIVCQLLLHEPVFH